MSCSNCNNGTCGDCNRSNTPCTTCPTASADCESLPSALQNFTNAFFGTVTKSVVNGQVVWTLPCNLEVGLPANPRLDTEGLACYFLRLFQNGIVGLTGLPGDTGDQGPAGHNAYTISTTAFNAPTLAQPTVQFNVVPGPLLSVGQTIFVPNIGWLQITNLFNNTTVFATLLELVTPSIAVSPAGVLVLPTGPRGLPVTGPTGPQGVPGPTGAPGTPGATGAPGADGADGAAAAAFTQTNLQYLGGANDYAMTAAVDPGAFVDFGGNDLEVTLPTAGTYLVTVQVDCQNNSGGIRQWDFHLHNATTVLAYPYSYAFLTFADSGAVMPLSFSFTNIISTATDNNLVQVWTRSDSVAGPDQHIQCAFSKIIYVKLA